MNLVQINERLKDLPMQVIQQYANGMNPEVPPYLALGELQRREMAQKQMTNAQGAAQGPQPSIKEQVEQKAGLMAAQGLQQQQMMQQMQQPRGPMPAPAGIPQPEAQPEMAMARGGLAGIPVRRDMFEYASGGIIAFAEGGQPKFETRYDKMNRENREAAERKRLEREDFNKQLSVDPKQEEMLEAKREFDALTPAEKSSERGQRLREFFRNVFTSAPAAVVQAPMDALPSKAVVPANPADFMGGPAPAAGGLPDALANAAGATGVKPPSPPRPVAQPAAMPGAAPQAPMQTGAPAFTPAPVSADRAGLEALMKSQQRQAPTAEGIIADVNALKPAGMQDEAQAKLLADQRGRAEARQASYEKSKPSGLDDLIRVFGQAGQFKGLSGLAPAYTANQQQRRSEDLAMERQQDELLTAIEGRGAAFDKDTFTARTGAMSKAQDLFGQSEKSIIDAAAKLYVADQGRLDADNKAKMDRDLREFEAAQRRSLEMMTIEQRERESKRTDARSPAAKATEYVNLKAQARALAAKGDKAGAAELDARADDMKGFSGGSGAGEENANTRSLRTALEAVNKRLELMGSDDPDYATLKKQQKDISDQLVGRALGTNAGGGGAATQGIPLPANATVKNLTVGTVYQTARGPAKWTGTAFAPI